MSYHPYSEFLHKGFKPESSTTIYSSPSVIASTPIISTKKLEPYSLEIPFARWPDYIKKIALKKAEEDAGVGDTIVGVIGDFGSTDFKVWYAENHPHGVMAKTCTCTREKWNVKYPYN